MYIISLVIDGGEHRHTDVGFDEDPGVGANSMPTGPLSGLRVVELGSMYAAPTAGRMLRDFGADVVKVEDPAAGDFARQWQPAHRGQSIGFARLNSGKRSVGIDLRSDAGRDLVRRLAAT